jgi:hypothetical protein
MIAIPNSQPVFCIWPLVALLSWQLAACGPSEEKKAQLSEEKRVNCLDKFCEGDVEPKHDVRKETVFKLNGKWFVGRQEYGNPNFGAMAFYWPSKAPQANVNAVKKADEVVRNKTGAVGNFYDVAIEIFLTGRQRWPTPQVERPWERRSLEDRWSELRQQGKQLERSQVRPGLDAMRVYEPDGKPYRHFYFIATDLKRIRGAGSPVAACDTDEHASATCTSGEFWQPDVYADFRFSAKHANDWPEIHQEIVRVLNLAKRVEK